MPEGAMQVIKGEEALVDYNVTAVDDTSSEAASDRTDAGIAEQVRHASDLSTAKPSIPREL